MHCSRCNAIGVMCSLQVRLMHAVQRSLANKQRIKEARDRNVSRMKDNDLQSNLFALTRHWAKLSMQPESSDGFASVGTVLPKEEVALLPGGLFLIAAPVLPTPGSIQTASCSVEKALLRWAPAMSSCETNPVAK